jgi:hypothetical protein
MTQIKETELRKGEQKGSSDFTKHLKFNNHE